MDSPKDAIPAANYLNIELGLNVWRLVSTELGTSTQLMEATPEGVVAHPVFVEARRLPGASLSPAQIMRIVLGWAPESQAWRLGMLLIEPGMTKFDTTTMQWCELAAWPDHVYNGRISGAKAAGQALARLLNRPFQFIEPNTQTRVAAFAGRRESPAVSLNPASAVEVNVAAPGSAYSGGSAVESPGAPLPPPPAPTPTLEAIALPEPAAPLAAEPALPPEQPPAAYPTIPLAPLPLRFSDWKLVLTPAGVRWRRLSGWWWGNLLRLGLFGVLAVLFLVLGAGARTSGLAPVEPGWLPTIGLLVGILMVGGVLSVAWRLVTATTVVVDGFAKEVYNKGLVFPFINWRVPFSQIHYLLISQTPPQSRGRRKRTDPMRISQEVWLHIYDGQNFYPVGELDEVEGKSWVWDRVRQHAQQPKLRRPLRLAEYDTPAHHAALQIADRIGVPTYIDLI